MLGVKPGSSFTLTCLQLKKGNQEPDFNTQVKQKANNCPIPQLQRALPPCLFLSLSVSLSVPRAETLARPRPPPPPQLQSGVGGREAWPGESSFPREAQRPQDSPLWVYDGDGNRSGSNHGLKSQAEGALGPHRCHCRLGAHRCQRTPPGQREGGPSPAPAHELPCPTLCGKWGGGGVLEPYL